MAGEAAGAGAQDVYALLEVLIHSGSVWPARRDFDSVDREPARRCNALVLDTAWKGDTHWYLAAPALGSALSLGRLERLLAPLVLADAERSDLDIAQAALERFTAAGLNLSRAKGDGPTVDAEAIAKAVGEVRLGLARWKGFGMFASDCAVPAQ